MPNVEAIAPQLFVDDLSQSVDWYVRVLGFAVAWRASEHAGIRLGPALIVLSRPATPGRAGKGACHLRLGADIDDYVAQIEAAGQPLTATLRDRPEYGMREAAVRDPDGNDIYIGEAL